jgi:cytochrome P450
MTAALKTYPQLDSRALPLQGHMREMQRDTYDFYLRQHAAHGGCLKFNSFPGMHFYSFTSSEAIHHVLIKARAKYSRGRRWSHIVSFIGGQGLVTSTGELWQEQRKLLQPYFQPAFIDKYMGTVVKNTVELADGWAKLPAGADINMSRAMMRLGLVNISDLMFNYDIRAKAEVFSEAMMDSFRYINRFVQNPLTPPRFLPTKFNRDFRKNKKIADDIVQEIIGVVRQEHEDCMVAALVKAGNSDRQLHDEIITLLMAGHDTLSTALAWTWRLLAQHPDVLKKLQDELDTELKGALPDAQNIERLVYTKMVYKETLRLYPSVWALHRVVEEPDEIEGYPVKRFSSVVLPVYATHRRPDYWKHPDQFWPEHFSKAESEGRPRFAYAPFGGGEHVCIGQHLANTEAVLILATLLQKFTPVIKDSADIKPIVNFTLKPERDIIALQRRR